MASTQPGALSLQLTPEFLTDTQAARWLQILHRRLAWRQEFVSMFGHRHAVPRLSAWFGPAYRYTGLEHRSAAWPYYLKPLLRKVRASASVPFNAMLATLYRTGADHVGWHADNERELGAAPVLAVVSLGAERTLCVRQRGEPDKAHQHRLTSGSLAIMPSGFQSLYQHKIQKTTRVYDCRISLSFRLVQSV